MNQGSVKSLMNSRVISILPETPILTAIDIILSSNFNGIPVTDKSGVLVGILTKYDLITNRASINDDTKVDALMNIDPLVLNEEASVEDAARAFSEHHKVDPIPVVNENRIVVGIISRYDMVKMFREHGVSFSDSSSHKVANQNNSNFLHFIKWTFLLLVIAGSLYYTYFWFLGIFTF